MFAWDPKASDEHMSNFLFSCKKKNIEVRAKALGHQPVGDNWTCGHHSLGYICLLARTEIRTALGAVVLPLMAADFIGQVQACLREAATARSDTVDELLSGVTWSNRCRWLGPREHPSVACGNAWSPGKISLRTSQSGGQTHSKVQALLKHLFAPMTAQMQRICPKRPKTNHPCPMQVPEPRPSPPSPLQHAPAQVSEPSPSPSPPVEHASAAVTEPSPSPSSPLEHGPAQVPKPSPSSPLHSPSVKSVHCANDTQDTFLVEKG